MYKKTTSSSWGISPGMIHFSKRAQNVELPYLFISEGNILKLERNVHFFPKVLSYPLKTVKYNQAE